MGQVATVVCVLLLAALWVWDHLSPGQRSTWRAARNTAIVVAVLMGLMVLMDWAGR
jgi:hypothetical protein